MGVWVVVPAFNEDENLRVVIPQIVDSLSLAGADGHVVVVDDGSTDATPAATAELCDRYPCVSVERLSRNQGKSAALKRGFLLALDAGASVVAMIDADGQDDPSELPGLLQELESGSDLVTGARLERRDRFVKRTTSRLYNRVTRVLSGVPGRDFNSGFKVMTAATARDVAPMLYGELHRYITVIAHWFGHRVVEIPVVHHERLHGTTKYGVNRFWRGFIDLITVRFLMSYEQRPSHFFGGVGLVSMAVGGVMLAYLLIERILGSSVGERPMLIAAVLLVIVGLQLLLFGLLAEIVVYAQHRPMGSARGKVDS